MSKKKAQAATKKNANKRAATKNLKPKKAPKNAKQKAPVNVDRLAFWAPRLREGGLIVSGILAIYFFFALTSYHEADPGFSDSGVGNSIKNLMGTSGAYLSDGLYSLVGFAAFMLPIWFGFIAWKLFKDRQQLPNFDWSEVGSRVLGLIITLLGFTALLALRGKGSDLPFGAGGIIGSKIAQESLTSFGLTGSRLGLLGVVMFGLTILTDLSWLKLIDKVGEKSVFYFELAKEKLVAYLDQVEEKREHVEVQKQRQETVAVKRVQVEKREPPKIQKPAVKKPEKSARVEKEKQASLFEVSGDTGHLPALSLLNQPNENNEKKGYSEESLEMLSRMLEVKLQDFNIEAEVKAVYPGPVVTRFEIQPAAGVKVSKITNVAKDLARSMAFTSVRIVEVIPGTTYVGVEIPNEDREMVFLSEVLSSQTYEGAKSPLTLALGKDISGEPIVADLAKMPHLLVAGTTGSGKSVGINVMILSLLYKSSPEDVRLIMVDPKMLELSVYEGIPHLLTPVVTDMSDAANALRWCVAEMERRYKLMAAVGVRNLAGFNKKVLEAQKAGEPIKDPLWVADENFPVEDQEAPELEKIPAIVVIIDEFADMIMIVGKKVEQLIARIAQKARAAGIHLILATQRPSVDVLTGLIKANIPSRIGFQVSSKIDSRTILDQGGAEQLLGHGDMLYLPPGTSLPTRVHGAFVDDDEVHRVVASWKEKAPVNYIENLLQAGETRGDEAAPGGAKQDSSNENDPLFDEAVFFVTKARRVSISSVQRKLRVGYNRAARIVEEMEAAGVVSEMAHNGQREVLAPPPPE